MKPIEERRRRARARGSNDAVEKDGRNVMAFLALICGICAWVPLVIVFAAPLAWVFTGLSVWTARKKNRRHGMPAAAVGSFLAVLAVIVQVGFAGFAFVVGWIAEGF